jgi:hypothetical protein
VYLGHEAVHGVERVGAPAAAAPANSRNAPLTWASGLSRRYISGGSRSTAPRTTPAASVVSTSPAAETMSFPSGVPWWEKLVTMLPWTSSLCRGAPSRSTSMRHPRTYWLSNPWGVSRRFWISIRAGGA